MKKFITATALALAFGLAASAQFPGMPKPQPLDLRTISSGKLTMTVDAGNGAKILSFKYEDKEIISQLQMFNAFGSTFWTSPQAEWNWPPVAEYDRLPYEVETKGEALVMNGKPSEKFGYSIRKEFVPGEDCIVVNYSIINHSDQTRKVAPWEITRVKGEGLIFFECPSSEIWPEGLMTFSDKYGCSWYNFDESKENRKINANGKGWLAYTNGELLLVKDFSDLEAGQAAPGEDEIQVYVNQGQTFIELESQGAYLSLAPGESLTYSVRWMLLPCRNDCKPSKTLLKAAKKNLK